MIGVVSYLCSQSYQNNLSQSLKEGFAGFICRDCDNEVVLLTAIENNLDAVDVVLLYQPVINDIISLMKDIKRITSNVRIILILNGERKHYVDAQLMAFRDFCSKEDIIFENRAVDIMNLVMRIHKGRLNEEDRFDDESKEDILDLPKGKKDKPKTVKNNIKEEAPQERKEAKTEPASKPKIEPLPPPEPIPEPKPKVVREKQDKHIRMPKLKSEQGCYTIAVFGTTRGTGVTNMVYTLSEFLCMNGKRVLAVNLTGGTEFDLIRGNADYINSTLTFARQNEENYDIVIYDIGTPLNISEKGYFCGLTDDYARGNIELLKRCSIKIGMAFGDAWQMRKCEYFLTSDEWKKLVSNDYIFLFDRDITKEMRSRYPNINIYNRNDTAFSNTIERLFLL